MAEKHFDQPQISQLLWRARPAAIAFLLTVLFLLWLLPAKSRLTLPAGDDQTIVGLSPQGDWAVTRLRPVLRQQAPSANSKAAVEQSQLRLWDTVTGKLRATIAKASPNQNFLISEDGQTLLTVGQNVVAWDTATGAERFQFPLRAGFGPGGPAVQFAPGGKTLVSMSEVALPKSQLTVRDAATGESRATMDVYWAYAISADGLRLAVVQDIVDESQPKPASPPQPTEIVPPVSQRILVCDLLTGAVQATLPHESLRIQALAFSPDGQILAAGTWADRFYLNSFPPRPSSAEIHLWNLATQQAKPPIKIEVSGDPASVVGLQFAGQGRVLITNHHLRQFIWDLSESPPKQIAAGFGLEARTISPDGRWWAEATLTDPVSITVTDAATLQVRHHLHGTGGSGKSFSPDGRILAMKYTGGNWSQKLRRRICNFIPFLRRESSHPQQEHIDWRAFDAVEHGVRLIDLSTGREIGSLSNLPFSYGVYLSNDNRTLAIQAFHSLEIWDMPPRRPWWAIFGTATLVGGVVLLIGRWKARQEQRPAA